MEKPSPFSLRNERESARLKLRTAILASAAEILAEGGADALSTRALAQAVGASTKVIYSNFGGMPQVIACVYEHGFQQLTAAFEKGDDATLSCAERLREVAHVYRQFAQQNPNLFALMYGPRAKTLVPRETDRNAAIASLNVIANIIASRRRKTAVDEFDSRGLAYAFWATIHGPVSLEASAWLTPNADELYERLVAEAIRMVTR
jgi:AcrR family transcriptional regulator